MLRWRAFLTPRGAAHAVFCIFAVILLGLIVLVLIARFVDVAAIAVMWLLVSVVAYAVREGRKPRRQRPIRRRGVERAPLVPFDREDDL